MQTSRSTTATTLLILLFSSLAAACGLKGPLYLPVDETAGKSVTEQSAESPADEQEEEDQEEEEQENEFPSLR